MQEFSRTMRLTIGEVLDDVSATEDQKEKVRILRQNDSKPLRQFLKYALDPTIEFMLPKGPVPHKQNPRYRAGFSDAELYSSVGRLYIFLAPHPTERYSKGFATDDKKNQSRREMKFISLLESFYVAEAEYLIQMKDKNLSCVDITTANLAFPGLISAEAIKQGKAHPKPTVQRTVIPPAAQRRVEVNGVVIELTPEQWVAYQAKNKPQPVAAVASPTPEPKPAPAPAPVSDEVEHTKLYTNAGKCKSCNVMELEVRWKERPRHGIYDFVVRCPRCNITTKPCDTRALAIAEFKAIKVPKKPIPKKADKQKSTKKIITGYDKTTKSGILLPTEEEKQQFSHKFRPHPNTQEFTEEVEEDLSGEKVAKPVFVPDDLPEEEQEIIEGLD